MINDSKTLSYLFAIRLTLVPGSCLAALANFQQRGLCVSEIMSSLAPFGSKLKHTLL